jgi:hypothetical protein
MVWTPADYAETLLALPTRRFYTHEQDRSHRMGGIDQARRIQPDRLAAFLTTPQAIAQETGEYGEQVRPALSDPDISEGCNCKP